MKPDGNAPPLLIVMLSRLCIRFCTLEKPVVGLVEDEPAELAALFCLAATASSTRSNAASPATVPWPLTLKFNALASELLSELSAEMNWLPTLDCELEISIQLDDVDELEPESAWASGDVDDDDELLPRTELETDDIVDMAPVRVPPPGQILRVD